MSFVPNVPSTRRKKEIKQEIETPKVKRERKRESEVQVASGPFAMGPAERNSRIKPTMGDTVTVKHIESINQISASKEESESEGEEMAHESIEKTPLMLVKMPLELPFDTASSDLNGEVGRWYENAQGEMFIQLGEVSFKVHSSHLKTDQLLCAIDDTKYVELGKCNTLLNCTPDLSSLL